MIRSEERTADAGATQSGTRWWTRWLWVLGAMVFALSFQGSRPLADPDEGRYAEAAREMEARGSWGIPFLAGRPHLTKPPATYWMARAGFKACGQNPWGARLAVGCAFGISILAAGALGRRLGGDQFSGKGAMLALATSPLAFVGGSLLTADVFLAASSAVAAAAGARALVDPRARRGWLVVFWAFLGLAFFFKGPPALLLLAGILPAWPLRRSPAAADRRIPWQGALAFLAIGLGWYLWLGACRPESLTWLIRTELLEAPFRRGALGRNGPFWMPAAVLLVGGSPWVLLTVSRWRRLMPSLKTDPVVRLLAGWIAAGLLVFTLSQARNPLYVLPLTFPLAVAAGPAMAAWVETRWRRAALLGLVVLLGAGLLGARAKGEKLPHFRHSQELARMVRLCQVERSDDVVIFQDRFLPGLAFALRQIPRTVAADPGPAPEIPADFDPKGLVAWVKTHPKGVAAVVPPRLIGAIPPELRITQRHWDPASGFFSVQLVPR